MQLFNSFLERERVEKVGEKVEREREKVGERMLQWPKTVAERERERIWCELKNERNRR